jgi:hypothetical protein
MYRNTYRVHLGDQFNNQLFLLSLTKLEVVPREKVPVRAIGVSTGNRRDYSDPLDRGDSVEIA